jgi:3-phenylpropionate/trans-cinnamate dioxygenase ferredoxin reductase component
MREGIVIMGAGEAGARAAIGLREARWTESITLFGDETHAPYERPASQRLR